MCLDLTLPRNPQPPTTKCSLGVVLGTDCIAFSFLMMNDGDDGDKLRDKNKYLCGTGTSIEWCERRAS